MNTQSTRTAQENHAVAVTILSQIPVLVRMSVGIRGDYVYGELFGGPSLSIAAKPRNRVRRLVITLNAADLYDVRLVDTKTHEVRVLIEGVYADQLGSVILSLESEARA